MTYSEKMILMHTIGLDRSDVAYRNFFAADPGHSDMPTLDSLVAKGFMVRETSAICPGLIFRVTKDGRDALKAAA